MSVESWNPDNAASEDGLASSINDEFMQRCIDAGQTDQLDNIQAVFSTEERSRFAPCMRLPAPHWQELAENLSAEDVYQAIRFFTLAEQQLSGWEAGDQSPVIALNKLLRKRGEPLSRDQVMWIKKNTDNHYLPNGAIL